jgi:hypothetical protein
MARDSLSPAASNDRNRQQCVDCKIWSPPTDTNYTLISTQCGWRLSRSLDAAGLAFCQWRCPDCWKKYRVSSGRSTR